MKIVHTIKLCIGTDLKLAITSAGIAIFESSWWISLPYFEKIVKSLLWSDTLPPENLWIFYGCIITNILKTFFNNLILLMQLRWSKTFHVVRTKSAVNTIDF